MGYRAIGKGDRISEYVLLEKLGQGGFGEVWKAEHAQITGKFVAIKVPTKPDSMDLIKKEAVFQHQLEHPNIVRTIGLDTEHDPPYFVMEFVEGKNLREFMAGEGILPPPYAIDIAVQVLEALSYAHSQGIIHKDIKPENILVEKRRVTVARDHKALLHFVKITDLGLGNLPENTPQEMVLSENSRTSGVRQMSGTLFYMAPEQMLNSRTATHQADIYSLGVVLYEMLTGELPLGMDLPSELNPVVSTELDQICKRALSINRDQRYQTAREMATDLQRAKEQFLLRLVSAGSSPAPAVHSTPAVHADTRSIRPALAAHPPEHRNPPPASAPPAPTPSIPIPMHVPGVVQTVHQPARPAGTFLGRVFEWSLLAFVAALFTLSALAYIRSRNSTGTQKTDPAPVAGTAMFGPVKIEGLLSSFDVSLDGRPLDRNLTEISLTFERHELKISREFFETRQIVLEPASPEGRRQFVVMDPSTHTQLTSIDLERNGALGPFDLSRQKGTLKVITNVKETQIILDGRCVGVALKESEIEPGMFEAIVEQVEAGTYALKLSAKGYKDVEVPVTIRGGDPVVLGHHMKLSDQAEASGFNFHPVSITSQPPGATVYVNEENRGVTPYDLRVPVGSYRIRFELKYHETREDTFKIVGQQSIQMTLGRIRGRASFESEPPGAVVVLDGRDVGASPQVLPVDGGLHTAEFQMPGHYKGEVKFEVLTRDQLVPLKVTLQKIPPAKLTITSEVAGDVFIDDVLQKAGLGQALAIEPGRHRVRVLGVEKEITLEAGNERPLRFELKDLGLVAVPAGKFLYGAPEPLPRQVKQHEETLGAYYIDQCELTNEQYGVFLDWLKRTDERSRHAKCDPNEGSGKNHTPRFWDHPEYNKPKMPVVGVDFYDACAYAAWAGKRLPTEKEWEKAARGTDGRQYPWGDDWQPNEKRLNWGDIGGESDGFKKAAPVGSFADGKSVYGCLDMAGNVEEWTLEPWDERGINRIVKGGTYKLKMWRMWERDFESSNQAQMNHLGFRCVVPAK